MLTDTDVEDHYNPSVRLIEIERNGVNCGFQLTRGKWDPYPWVSCVEEGTAAFQAGIKCGDCLLEINGEDVVGQRISEIAELVKSKVGQISLLLWNAGVDPQCNPEAICCGPMPNNLQRLSACMTTILAFLECPVCLDTIQPPAYQCDHGHLICIKCRAKTERCPVCRLRFNRGRSLLADQVYNALIDAFNLKEEKEEARSAKIQQIFKLRNKNKAVPDIKITQSHTNKFLARIIGKASSVDNLSTNSKLLTPNGNAGADFSSNSLKTKSLSANEIFQPDSPAVSRSGSISRIGRIEKCKPHLLDHENRPASYHGSFENLNGKIEDATAINNGTQLKFENSAEETFLFHCPFKQNCSSLVKGKDIVGHFQKHHQGPLIQYFTDTINLDLKKVLEEQELCYIITLDDNVFFLRVNVEEKNERHEDVLMWIWFLGSKKAAKFFETQIELVSGTSTLISVRNSIHSLSCVTLQEIKKYRKGFLFNSDSFNTLSSSTPSIIIKVNIIKSDNY